MRIEDIDPPREIPGASNTILRQLDAHGLHWDDSVLYQSTRLEAYRAALEQLDQKGLIYNCNCNRSRLRELNGIYDGRCANRDLPNTNCAVRLRCPAQKIIFDDLIVGRCQQHLSREAGDFILRRRDGLVAYQLAVVVDDQAQQITQVLRGADLLDSTARQIYLQQCLNYATPDYGHIPLALNSDGQKLSKQNLATGLPEGREPDNLWQALHWLNQQPPDALRNESVATLMDWAIDNWRIQRLQQHPAQPAPDGF